MPAQRILLQDLLNLQRQAREAAAHIRVARCEPDTNASRNRDHARSAFNVAEISADEAAAPIRTRASRTSTTIAAASSNFAAVGEAKIAGAGSIITGANPEAVSRLSASRRHL